jgi:hypothetical protein
LSTQLYAVRCNSIGASMSDAGCAFFFPEMSVVDDMDRALPIIVAREHALCIVVLARKM